MNFFYITGPFNFKDHSKIVSLIKEADLECNTLELPEFGVAIQSEETQEIIGYIGAHKKYGTVGHIDVLVVDGGTRGKGLGTYLINLMCKLLVANNINSFSSEVEFDNPKAIKLYAKLGAKMTTSLTFNVKVDDVIETTSKFLDKDLECP